MKKNLSEIRRLLHERKEGVQALIRFLILKGIAPAIAEEITLELAGEIGQLQGELIKRIKVCEEISSGRLLFVGPTGVGKTTTVLKLADYYLKQGRKVALATLDEEKKRSFASWAEGRRIPFCDRPTGNEELLLIDTEGCNFYQPNRVEALGEKIADWEGEIVLVLSAAAKEVDLYGAIHQFSLLSPTSLAFTKLDETLAAGVLINVSSRTDLPIRYVAYGFPLPGEIHPAKSEAITHKILTDLNQEEFQLLRQLTL